MDIYHFIYLLTYLLTVDILFFTHILDVQQNSIVEICLMPSVVVVDHVGHGLGRVLRTKCRLSVVLRVCYWKERTLHKVGPA